MQNDMDNYIRDLARSCAKEAFEKAREKASRSDFMGINSGKVAKIVVNNRKGADDMLLSLAAKAESAASLTDLIPIHKAVYGILETVDCPLQRAHLGPDEFGMFGQHPGTEPGQLLPRKHIRTVHTSSPEMGRIQINGSGSIQDSPEAIWRHDFIRCKGGGAGDPKRNAAGYKAKAQRKMKN